MEIYNQLVELARVGKLTTYTDIASLAGLSMNNPASRQKISELLGEILMHEDSEGRPLLTAIVVHKGDKNMPGEGFFTISTELGYFNGSSDPLERLEFWVSQVKEVNAYWSDH